MDRISAVLFFGIAVMVMISSYMIYDTWVAASDAEGDILTFNDDTSLTNNSNSCLWLRARIDDEGPDDGGVSVSGTNADAAQHRINDEIWIKDEDGWYYYYRDLDVKQTTEPFVETMENHVEGAIDAKGTAVSVLKVKVEAVDQAWLTERPSGCKEAFEMLRTLRKEAEPAYL